MTIPLLSFLTVEIKDECSLTVYILRLKQVIFMFILILIIFILKERKPTESSLGSPTQYLYVIVGSVIVRLYVIYRTM